MRRKEQGATLTSSLAGTLRERVLCSALWVRAWREGEISRGLRPGEVLLDPLRLTVISHTKLRVSQ